MEFLLDAFLIKRPEKKTLSFYLKVFFYKTLGDSCLKIYSSISVISTRLFRFLPASVVLGAIGSSAPLPCV